jgi:hypothetical protein
MPFLLPDVLKLMDAAKRFIPAVPSIGMTPSNCAGSGPAPLSSPLKIGDCLTRKR